MSEHIPQWVFVLFGLGSPLQELLNVKVPERYRALTLWGVAAVIVGLAIAVTPLESSAFNIQLALVYAALASGWAASQLLGPGPTGGRPAVTRAILVFALFGAMAFAWEAWAQADTLAVSIAPDPEVAPHVAPSVLFTSAWDFLLAQVISALSSLAVRWLSPLRRAS